MADSSGSGRRKIWRITSFALGLALAAACQNDSPGRQTPGRIARCDIQGMPACTDSQGCSAAGLCMDGCCHAACTVANDCAEAAGCGEFGCVCEEGACIPTPCSASAECEEDRSCVAGTCVEPEPVEAASCRLSPPFAAIRSGEKLAFSLEAFDSEGKLIVPTPAFQLETSDPNRAQAGKIHIVGGESVGAVEVLGRIGNVSCAAEVESYGEPAEGKVRILAIDALSRLPVQGAHVQIEGVTTGETTDERGLAIFDRDALPPAPRIVSVFHEGYSYVSLFDVSSSDILVPLSRNPERPLAGGFTGTFKSELFEPSRLNFGLAGASFPGNLIDLDVFILVGPIERVEIDIGGARSADLSAGLVFGLGNTWFKESYRVEALPNACADRLASQEGRCGYRTAWGLAGGIPLEDLPLDAIESGGEVDAGSLLAELLPNIRRLRSAIVPSIAVEALPRAGGEPDWERLPKLDMVADKRLALRADVRIPPLPGEAVDGVIGIVGAQVPHEGLVPMGLTGAVAEEGSREIVDPVRGRNGVLDLRFAPLHGGIEGSDYVVFVLAVDLEGLSGGKACTAEDRSGCTPVSGLLTSAKSLPWGSVVDLHGEGFLDFAEEALFDPGARRLDVGAPVEGATLMRLKILSKGAGWELYFPADRTSIEIPTPIAAPDRMEDPSSSLQVMDADLDLDALLAPGEVDLSDFTLRARRFSTMDLPR